MANTPSTTWNGTRNAVPDLPENQMIALRLQLAIQLYNYVAGTGMGRIMSRHAWCRTISQLSKNWQPWGIEAGGYANPMPLA